MGGSALRTMEITTKVFVARTTTLDESYKTEVTDMFSSATSAERYQAVNLFSSSSCSGNGLCKLFAYLHSPLLFPVCS